MTPDRNAAKSRWKLGLFVDVMNELSLRKSLMLYAEALSQVCRVEAGGC